MVYPSSPFTKNFNDASIYALNDVNPVGYDEDEHVNILKWLCTSPNVTSFRVNTLRYSVMEIKECIERCLDELRIKLCRKPLKVTIHPVLNEVVLVESWEENDLDLERKKKEVIIDNVCGTVVLRGAHIYAPGVMAMQNGTRLGDIVSVYVDASKKCRKGLRTLYECANKIFIGNGIVQMTRADIFNNMKHGIAIEMTDVTSRCPALNEKLLPPGSALLQNIPSVIASRVLNPQPGDTVLDMCASPGNKTTHIAQLMNDTVSNIILQTILTVRKGVVAAIDKTPSRHMKLEEKCREFSLNCVKTHQFDSTRFQAEPFDRVMLDAPCSGLGQRPQLSNTITDKVLRSYVPLQRKLFENAVALLKHGGCLVYSTCTITLAENEGIVSWALKKFDCLELMPAQPAFGGHGWPGTDLTDEQLKCVQRFGPGQEVDSVGFFIACFHKKIL